MTDINEYNRAYAYWLGSRYSVADAFLSTQIYSSLTKPPKENIHMNKFNKGNEVRVNGGNYTWIVRDFRWVTTRKGGHYVYGLGTSPSGTISHWATEKTLSSPPPPPFKAGFFQHNISAVNGHGLVQWFTRNPGVNYRRVNVTPADE